MNPILDLRMHAYVALECPYSMDDDFPLLATGRMEPTVMSHKRILMFHPGPLHESYKPGHGRYS